VRVLIPLAVDGREQLRDGVVVVVDGVAGYC
jgi:hypothetical protein